MSSYHIPVLADRCIELLNINPKGVYADLTFGGGGHSSLILERLDHEGRLFAFDQDRDAENNIPNDDRFHFVASNFKYLRSQLRWRGVEQVDGILADLGVSSHHFDTAERGFSFRFDSRLDMRMNQRAHFSARELVNEYSAEKLGEILRLYGELDTTYKIANCIERARAVKSIDTVGDLISAVEPCTPRKEANKFLTKLFQALRIEVNGEMEALKMALEQSLKVLRPGGRLVVMSYHSLEDRLVKNFMRSGNFTGHVEKDFYGRTESPFELVTRKAEMASEHEVAENPRARSAKLRCATRIA